MKYYVHTLTDNQNDHEVHTETCFRLPEDARHPGCPVFAGMKLPEGAVVTE
ncbi:hypothetical protein ACQW9R_004159 [Escherichia coli]